MPKIMAQYPKTKSIGSVGSISLGSLKVLVVGGSRLIKIYGSLWILPGSSSAPSGPRVTL